MSSIHLNSIDPLSRMFRIQWVLIGCLSLVIVIAGGYALRNRESAANHAPSQAKPRSVFFVEGQLLVADELADNASIAFHPLGAGINSGVCSVAVTRADGSFKLTTYAQDDGAPPGEYAVTILWPDPTVPVDECACQDPTEHDRLCGMYADPLKTPLHVSVVSAENHLTLRATGCSERERFERRLRRMGTLPVFDSLYGSEKKRTLAPLLPPKRSAQKPETGTPRLPAPNGAQNP